MGDALTANEYGEPLVSFVVKRHPVVAYFVLTFAISWLCAFAVAAPRLFRGEPLPQMTGILMFPAMLLGPSIAGIFLTGLLEGRKGLREMFSRMSPGRIPWRWCASLLIPPTLVLAVLVLMWTFVSPVYRPNFFPIGILFGIPAGFLEEIGWTGFALPRMQSYSVWLGLLWSAWHLPVINYLGVATPHGDYWIPFFLAFTLAMTAMRVLIAWIYAKRGSLLLAQLMHVSSTGSLVVLGASHVTARQEAIWYAVYGVALWAAVAIIAARTPRTVEIS